MKEKNPWFEYALDDFKSISLLLDSGIYRAVCFHAQQFAEKVLKGILSQRGVVPPRTHDLQTLSQAVMKTGTKLDIDAADLEFLSGIYIEYRYPSDLGLLPSGMPDEEDGRKASAIADNLYQQIEGIFD